MASVMTLSAFSAIADTSPTPPALENKFGKSVAFHQLNKENSPESYPYISHKGNHFYFTRNVDGKTVLFMCSRNASMSPFGAPVEVSHDLPYNSYSIWMNSEETKIWCIASGELFFSQRANASSRFEDFNSVSLKGYELGYISQPSLTPDEKELYMYESKDGVQNILVYKKTESGFTFHFKYSTIQGLMPGPGQLTKDGLGFMLSLEKDKKSEGLYMMVRGSVYEKFSICNPFTVIHNVAKHSDLLQPSISADGNVLVYVGGNNNSWDNNDFLMSEKKPTMPVMVYNSVPEKDENLVKTEPEKLENPMIPNQELTSIPENPSEQPLSVFPNPFNETAQVEFTLKESQLLKADVYTLDGRLIKNIANRFTDSGIQRLTIDQGGMSPGVYVIRIQAGNEVMTARVVYTGL